jgi:hypothetical protein
MDSKKDSIMIRETLVVHPLNKFSPAAALPYHPLRARKYPSRSTHRLQRQAAIQQNCHHREDNSSRPRNYFQSGMLKHMGEWLALDLSVMFDKSLCQDCTNSA